jgi:hypothetical protein
MRPNQMSLRDNLNTFTSKNAISEQLAITDLESLAASTSSIEPTPIFACRGDAIAHLQSDPYRGNHPNRKVVAAGRHKAYGRRLLVVVAYEGGYTEVLHATKGWRWLPRGRGGKAVETQPEPQVIEQTPSAPIPLDEAFSV